MSDMTLYPNKKNQIKIIFFNYTEKMNSTYTSKMKVKHYL